MPAALLAAWRWFTGTAAGRACLVAALALLAVLGIYRKGRSEGRAEEQQAAREETLRRYEERADVEEDLARLPADRKRDELRSWTQPGP